MLVNKCQIYENHQQIKKVFVTEQKITTVRVRLQTDHGRVSQEFNPKPKIKKILEAKWGKIFKSLLKATPATYKIQLKLVVPVNRSQHLI